MSDPRTRPAPHQPVTTTQAVQAVIAEKGADWPVVSFQTLTVIQAIMEDGTVEYGLVWPKDQPEEANRELVAGAARELDMQIGYRCICGANSPTSPQCPDFPDCLPGGGS